MQKNQNPSPTSKPMNSLKISIFVISGATMAAHGARMMYQGLFHPTSYYPAPTPTSLDFYFDWLTLTVLGILVFAIAIYSFYQNKKTKQEKHIHSSFPSGKECFFPT